MKRIPSTLFPVCLAAAFVFSAGPSFDAAFGQARKKSSTSQKSRSTKSKAKSKSTKAKSKSKSKAESATGRLPAHFGKLDLKDEQRDSIYKIQASYRSEIDDLTEKLAKVRAAMNKEIESVLTTTQRRNLAKMRKGSSPTKSKSKSKSSASKSKAKSSRSRKSKKKD